MKGLEIVGIAMVVKEAYQDPTTDNANWVVVDISPVRALEKPVTLAEIKAEPKLKNMELVTNSRLSVQKVAPEEWKWVLKMSGTK